MFWFLNKLWAVSHIDAWKTDKQQGPPDMFSVSASLRPVIPLTYEQFNTNQIPMEDCRRKRRSIRNTTWAHQISNKSCTEPSMTYQHAYDSFLCVRVKRQRANNGVHRGKSWGSSRFMMLIPPQAESIHGRQSLIFTADSENHSVAVDWSWEQVYSESVALCSGLLFMIDYETQEGR